MILTPSANEAWRTPDRIFDPLNREFGFQCDVAATDKNTKCAIYFTKRKSALTRDWPLVPCWMNPPYSMESITAFMHKAREQQRRGVTTVCLLPVKTDQSWWHDYVWQQSGVEIRWIRGRVQFVGATSGAKFCSVIVIFRGQK